MMSGRRVWIDPDHPDQQLLLDAARIIRQGGIVGYPTETFYGLAVDPFNAAAVQILFALKGRASTQALILLVGTTQAVFDLGHVKGAARGWFDALVTAFWPGPLTLVLRARRGLACPALAGHDTVAVRLSSHGVALRLPQALGGPITSTSANFAGEPPPAKAEEIGTPLVDGIDLTLDAGSTAGKAPSTILDLTGARPRLLRAGSLSQAAIEAALRQELGPNPQPIQ